MNISEFIKETIRQVCDGVIEVSLECSQLGVVVNPTITVGEKNDHIIPRKPSTVAMQRRVQKLTSILQLKQAIVKKKMDKREYRFELLVEEVISRRVKLILRQVVLVFQFQYACQHKMFLTNSYKYLIIHSKTKI